MSDGGEAALQALLQSYRLKHLPRAGWVRVGVSEPEDVAAHSWGVAWLVLNLLPAHLNLERALSYAVLHDLPEVIVGDITPHDGVAASEKHRREDEAMRTLCQPLPAHLYEIWRRYEDQSDDEAVFVRQLDRLDMALQAAVYQDGAEQPLDEFLDSAASVIVHPRLVPIIQAIRAKMLTV